MSNSKYEDISRLNNGSAMASFLGRCLHGAVSPLGGTSTKWKFLVRFVGKDPKKYIEMTSFFDTKAKAEEKQLTLPDGTVKKMSKVTLDLKSDKKYISASVKQNVLLNGKGVTTVLAAVPVADTTKAAEIAKHIVPAMDLHKIFKEQQKKCAQQEAFIDFVATVRQLTEERVTEKGTVADIELMDVSGKAGSNVCHLSCSAWHEHVPFLKGSVGKACLFLHMKLGLCASKVETSHGCSITLLEDDHPMKAALDEAYINYKAKLPDDAVQVTQNWQPGSSESVDTSGRQPLFCAAALRANMAFTTPEIDDKKVCQFRFLITLVSCVVFEQQHETCKTR